MSQIERKPRLEQINQSRSWIFEALQQLMFNSAYHDITIAQIVEKAGVSRQTFYRHFKTKSDVINWRIDQTFSIYMDKLKKFSRYELRSDLILVFQMMKRDVPLLQQLFSQDLEHLVLKRLTIHCYHLESVYEFKSDRELQYVSDYFAGGIFMVLLKWIRDNTPETEEEMADLVLERCFINNYDEMTRAEFKEKSPKI